MKAAGLSIRQKLSRLKNSLFALDLQNIYHLPDLVPVRKHAGQKPPARFSIYRDAEALGLVEKMNPMSQHQRDFALQRLQAGDILLIGSIAEEPVFYGWLMFDEIEITYDVFMPLPPGVVFAYNLFTVEKWRRRGVMSDFYSFVTSDIRLKGAHSLYCGISTGNSASVKAHLKNGFVKAGYFYTLRIRSLCLTLSHFEKARHFHINYL